MGFLDRAIDGSFRDQAQGRVVVLYVKGRSRGYRIASAAEEAKIRAFIKMFTFAQMSIQLLGLFATFGWVDSLRGEFGRAERWSDLLGPAVTIVIAYSVFAILPLILLWRLYRRSLSSLVALDEEVPVAPSPAARTWRLVATVLGGLMLLLGIVIFLAARHR